MLFIHRRKFLRANLLGAFKRELSKAEVDAVLVEMELPENARSEELSVEQFIKMCEILRARVPDWKV
jgi:16S rRNA (adenine1518-N6/adenine1519-N6)-dimethyltransferase